MRKLAACLAVVTSPAWADISRPTPIVQAHGWPSWAIVLVTFILFLGLIVLLSRFVRADRGNGNKGDDGGGLFGP
jgi:hypothetical protein